MDIFARIAKNLIVSYDYRTPRERIGILLGLMMTAFIIISFGIIVIALSVR